MQIALKSPRDRPLRELPVPPLSPRRKKRKIRGKKGRACPIDSRGYNLIAYISINQLLLINSFLNLATSRPSGGRKRVCGEERGEGRGNKGGSRMMTHGGSTQFQYVINKFTRQRHAERKRIEIIINKIHFFWHLKNLKRLEGCVPKRRNSNQGNK